MTKEQEQWECYGSYQSAGIIACTGMNRTPWRVMLKRWQQFKKQNGSLHASVLAARRLFASNRGSRSSDLSSLTHRPPRLSWSHGSSEDERGNVRVHLGRDNRNYIPLVAWVVHH